MDVIEAINNRVSIRTYTDEPIPQDIIEKILAAGMAAPAACNLDLTEFIVVTDVKLLNQLESSVSDKFGWANTMVVLLFDSRFSIQRNAAYTSMGAAMQNMLLTAYSEGIAACPMAGFNNDKNLKDILNIPAHYTIGLLMSLGYARGDEYKLDQVDVSVNDRVHINKFYTTRELNPSLDIKDWSLEDLVNYRERLAPVYLYPGRYRLQTFKPAWYKKAADILESKIPAEASVLDMFSYDLCFVRELMSKYGEKNITAADIIRYTTEVLKSEHDAVSTTEITAAGIQAKKKYDVISFVFKLEYSNDINFFIKDSVQHLNKNGLIFIVLHKENFVKVLLKQLKNLYKRIKGDAVNVYENNSHYKIGPYRSVRRSEIKKILHKNKMQKREEGSWKPGHTFLGGKNLWLIYEHKV